jgi:hypothetical protein
MATIGYGLTASGTATLETQGSITYQSSGKGITLRRILPRIYGDLKHS